MKIKSLVKKYYPFIISVIVILLIIILINQNKFLKKQFSNISKFSQTSSFIDVTSPTVFGNSFTLQKWNGGTSYSTLSTGNSGDSTKIPTTNVPNYNIISPSSWSWFDSTGVTSSTAKFLGIVVSGTNWFVNIATTATPVFGFTEYSVSFSTTTGTLFNIVSQSNRSTPLTFGSNIYNNNYLYKEKDSNDKFLCISTDVTGAVLKCASPDKDNMSVLTYNFRMTDNSIQDVNTLSGTITYTSPFLLGIWNGGSSWNTLSAGAADGSGQYKPTLDKATPDNWAWASDSKSDDYSKYLAVKVNGTWNYIIFNPANGVVTFSTTQGTLFNIVNSVGDRTTPKNIINSINNQNYLYRVKGLAVETYLAISTDATGNLLKVVTMGSGNIKSYNFKMTNNSIQNINTLSEPITYTTPFSLSTWNGGSSWNSLSAGAADASGHYKPTLDKATPDQWVWANDTSGKTDDYSKYLAIRLGGTTWNYITFDPANGVVTFSTTQGTLFNVVNSVGDRTTPKNIISSIDNQNYLYRVNGQAVETYLAISTDATGNLLKVVAMGSGDIKSYNFKMSLISSIQNVNTLIEPITYTTPFSLSIWNGGSSWNTLSAGGADASGNYKPTLDKARPDKWVWASDTSGNTDDYSKYLAIKLGGTTWNYVTFDSTNGIVTFSTTQGTLFNVVNSVGDRTTPKNIISSIDNQNYLYRVNGQAVETYLAISTDATGNLLKVVAMGSGNIKSYNFKMFISTPPLITVIDIPGENSVSHYDMWLSKWNGDQKDNYPNYNLIGINLSGSLIYNIMTNNKNWAWLDVEGLTDYYSKFLIVNDSDSVSGLTWKYLCFDSETDLLTFSTTQGTLFNIVNSTGNDKTTPLNINNIINNADSNNYLYKVNGSNTKYLYVSKNDNLRVNDIGISDASTYNFKMDYTTKPIIPTFTYSNPFILNLKVNGVWSTVSAGESDTDGNFTYVLNKSSPDQWAWVKSNEYVKPPNGQPNNSGLAVNINGIWKHVIVTFYNSIIYLSSSFRTHLAIWQPGNVYLSADQLLNSPSLYLNKDISIIFYDFIYQTGAVLNIDDNNKHIYGIQYSARTDNKAYIFKMTAI